MRLASMAAAVAACATAAAIATEVAGYRIVLATPLSGQHASMGLAQRAALEEAVAKLNAAGGIGGRTVTLSVHDDACRRETAARLAHTLTTPPAPPPLAVIGHPCASAAEAAAPIYQQAGVPMLAAGNRHPALTERRAGALIWRVGGRDDRQGDDAARRLRQLAGKDGGIVLLHDRTAMARAMSGAAARALMSAAAGGAPAPPSIGIVAGETDYTKAVREVAAARPSAMLFAGFPAEAAILLRQLRAAGISAPLLLSDANATAELAAHAGALLDTGVEVMLPVATAATGSIDVAATDSREAISAKEARTAMALILEILRATPAITSTELAEALASPSRDGLSFDAKGDAIAPSFAPFRWHESHWRRVR